MVSIKQLAGWMIVLAAGRLLAADPNAGPLADRFPLTLALGQRLEVLGPLFYDEEKDSQRTYAVPPVFSLTRDPETDFTEFDFLYPALTYDRFGSEYRWQLGQVISFSGGQNQAEQKARRFTLFPIYFQQRSAEPGENYTAVFPIYGHLKKRILRDEIFFVLFPVYGQSRKRDVVTDNYFYPIVHVRHGDGLTGWQFWPLVGHEHKKVTSRTNHHGDVDPVYGKDSWFVLWPFFLKENSGIGGPNPQRHHSVLPIYNYIRSPVREVTHVIWPFFAKIVDREKKYTEWHAPWPLIVFARGEGKTINRVMPFYSKAKSANLESDFLMWPIYKYNRFHDTGVDRQRTRILFFLYSDTIQKNLETGQAQRRTDFLPLFTRKQDYNGSSRLQILTVLEPFLPNNKSVERNYSHIWSLWRSERNTKTSSSSQSLLWNLYRRDVTSDSKKCSLLFGLLQYQSNSEGRRLRLLYIPVVRTRSAESNNSK